MIFSSTVHRSCSRCMYVDWRLSPERATWLLVLPVHLMTELYFNLSWKHLPLPHDNQSLINFISAYKDNWHTRNNASWLQSFFSCIENSHFPIDCSSTYECLIQDVICHCFRSINFIMTSFYISKCSSACCFMIVSMFVI